MPSACACPAGRAHDVHPAPGARQGGRGPAGGAAAVRGRAPAAPAAAAAGARARAGAPEPQPGEQRRPRGGLSVRGGGARGARPPPLRAPAALWAAVGCQDRQSVRARRSTAAGSWRATAPASAGRSCRRARAWRPLSCRRCARWPTAVRASLGRANAPARSALNSSVCGACVRAHSHAPADAPGPGRACDGCRRRTKGPCRGRVAVATSTPLVPACWVQTAARRAPAKLRPRRAVRCGAAGDGGGCCPRAGSLCDAPAVVAEARFSGALAGLLFLFGASRALAAALARAGALGAALRLARRSVGACAAPRRELRAALALSFMDRTLRAAGGHSPPVVRVRAAAPLPAPAQAGAVLLMLCGRGGRSRCTWTSRRRRGRAAPITSAGWPPWRPPSRALRPRSRRASRPRRRPAWTTCACACPRSAQWAAGGRGARRACSSRRPCCARERAQQSPGAPRARRCGNLAGTSEAGLPLQQCSGCSTARFCSPACHEAAWRAGHRGACRRARKRA